MEIWNDILAAAVVGTEQREFCVGSGRDGVGSLLGQLKGDDREETLLSAASIVAMYRGAGSTTPVDTTPVAEADHDDEISRGSGLSGQHLALMLEGEFRDVLPEWLAAMSEARKRVPEEYLPALLEFGRFDSSLRGLIGEVLGRRGEWLAAQNPAWAYATRREAKDVWETGTREERVSLLKNLRTSDPVRARELLATTWSEEPAKDRATFLETLRTELSVDDEVFLEETLLDRSVEVRRVTRSLLAGFHSQFSGRLRQMAQQLFRFSKPLIGKARIEVVLPEDPVALLKANGIEIENPPRSATRSVGPKAWLLKEIISLIPITFWSEVWRQSPLEIIRAADESDWRESFALGFVAAVQRDRDPDWVEALVTFSTADPAQAPLFELVSYLPAARLEALSLRALQSKLPPLHDTHPALRLLLAHQSAWSDRLSRAVVSSLKKRIGQGKDKTVDWQTKAALKQFARYVSPALHDELLSGWPAESETWASWTKAVDTFQSLLAFRRDMHQAIAESKNGGGLAK